MTRIQKFGWKGAPEGGIGRVISAHGDYYHLVADEQREGEILARKKKSVFKYRKRVERQETSNLVSARRSLLNAELLTPITGDFVRFRYNAHGESMITEVLPRFSHFERKDPTARRQSQTLAVNFDTLFIMMSLNENFSTPRIERYLTLAEDLGDAEAVVVLTKMDLWQDGDEELVDALVETIDGRAPLVKLSSFTGQGLDDIRAYARPGRTVAFIGSSGVGKSSLLNTLAGEEWAAVQEIQEWSGKGRHTTTSRELVMLPDGAMVIDTPGIREIGRVGETDDELVKGESTHRWRRKA